MVQLGYGFERHTVIRSRRTFARVGFVYFTQSRVGFGGGVAA